MPSMLGAERVVRMSFSSDPSLQVNQLPISIEFPKEQERFYEILTLWAKRVTNSVNSKEGGLFSLEELFNFKQFFIPNNPNNFRNDYRKTFDITGLNGGPIAGGATVSFPHNITGLNQSTMVYAGCSSATPTYFSVMYPYIYLDGVNINFTNPLPATALNTVIGVAEYLKN